MTEQDAMLDAYLAAGRPPVCPRCGGVAQGLQLPAGVVGVKRWADRVCPPCHQDLAGELQQEVG